MKQFIINAQQELNIYIEILKKWQKAVNLISPSTISDIWNRHVIDSAQLFPLIPQSAHTVIDLGSGAGFPGLVLAILNQKNKGPVERFILIESDNKKSLFLKEVVRILSLPVTILNQRIESVNDYQADVITARGLASLSELFNLGKSLITPQTTCLFLKGKSTDEEIKNCPISCHIEKIKSITNSNSFILKITEVHYG